MLGMLDALHGLLLLSSRYGVDRFRHGAGPGTCPSSRYWTGGSRSKTSGLPAAVSRRLPVRQLLCISKLNQGLKSASGQPRHPPVGP